jgi:AraC-like DNA-binding protein
MRPAASLQAYLRKPQGTYVAGSTFLHLCHNAKTNALFLWGRPSADDIEELVGLLRGAAALPRVGAYVSYADVRGLTGADPAAYQCLAEYHESAREVLKTRTVAQAVVRGHGFAASVAAGFFAVVAPPFPYRVFAEPREAAAWLRVDLQVVEAWEALKDEVVKTGRDVTELRAWLAHSFREANVELAARRLTVSIRTLQRRLRTAGTSFQRELDSARLSAAKERLEAHDTRLGSLACDLGFATQRHLTDWFRRLTGQAPSEYRRTFLPRGSGGLTK